MNFVLIAFLLQIQIALPQRTSLEDPALTNPVPKQVQKDYDKLWERFLTAREDAKVFSDLDKLLKKNPDVISALLIQAYVDLYSGRGAEGERRLQAVLSRRPSDPIALYYLAELAYSRNDFVSANDFYTRLRAVRPSAQGADTKAQRSLLLAMETLVREAGRAAGEGRLADAERSYRKALELAPREGTLHGQLAGVLLRQGKQTEAEAELRLQRQFSGPAGALVASDRDLAVTSLDDVGRWGSQIEHFREIQNSNAITREQLAALLTGYFPQLTEFRQSPEIMTDVQGSWAESSIRMVVSVGLLDAMGNHTFQPSRTVSRGEFAAVLSRLARLLGVSAGSGPSIAPLDVVPDSVLFRELQPVLDHGLLSLDKAGNFDVGGSVRGEEAVNTAEKLLRLIQKKAA